MYAPNVARLLASLPDDAVVVDIGGWACPFNRADYVIDAEPFETRGYYGTIGLPPSQGGDVERFTRDRWIVRDICDRAPYPFADKSVDFVICSHTLEDVRDPLWVCAEMMRIAKAGYIEVPSREWETCRGHDSARTAGVSHHRWLIDIDGAGVTFLMKYHLIHAHWRYSLPASHLRAMPEARAVQWLFWTDRFEARERILHGLEAQAAELAGYVERVRPYPAWRHTASEGGVLARRVAGAPRRYAKKVLRGR